MTTVITAQDPRIRTDMLQSILGDEYTVQAAELSSTEQIVEAVGDARALVVDPATSVSAAVFEACHNLEVVACASAGVDSIDIPAADDHGVTVTNVPEYCTEEVSTHLVSLLLSSLRRLKTLDRAVENGEWDWTDGQPIHRLAGRTVGFHSFGRIARAAAEKLAGFDCELVAADPYVDAEKMAEYDVEDVSFEELLQIADHVSIQAPLTEETYELFDRGAFEQLNDSGVVVNVGRGPIIDEDALVWALDNGEIGAAGLDVLANLPPENSQLTGREDVIVTPHSAFYSEEALANLSEDIANNLLAVFAGEQPEGYIDPTADWL
jgi:D-3-phosphoglycerate dehydrogenase